LSYRVRNREEGWAAQDVGWEEGGGGMEYTLPPPPGGVPPLVVEVFPISVRLFSESHLAEDDNEPV